MKRDSDGINDYSESLDSYVEQEMLKHYGRNVMHNSVQPGKSLAPYKKIHSKGFFSVMSIVCAVLFLAGAGVITSVLFSSGIPVNGTVSEKPSSAAVFSKTEETSSQPTVSQPAVSQSAVSQSAVSQSTPSKTEETSSQSTESQPAVSQSTVSQSAVSQSAVSQSTESQSAPSKTEESSSEEVSSVAEDSSDNTRSRPEYYSLPEASATETATGEIPQMNGSGNPNDTVTTGRRIRAGAGIVLIVLSFASALWLYKLKESEEYIQ